MQKSWLALFVVLVLTVLTTGVRAGEKALDSLINIALEHNPELTAASFHTEVTYQTSRAAGKLPDPVFLSDEYRRFGVNDRQGLIWTPLGTCRAKIAMGVDGNKIHIHFFVSNQFDVRFQGIVLAVLCHGTNQLANPATGTSVRIHNQI